MDEATLNKMAELLVGGDGIPSVFGSFKRFIDQTYPEDRQGELLESARRRFERGDGPPQLPLAPGINLRWGLPDNSQQAWFVTVRDDDDPEGKAFFTIRITDQTAALLAAWCLHLQRIKVPDGEHESQ